MIPTLYTRPHCAPCKDVKAFLDDHPGIEINITESNGTVPKIIADKVYVGNTDCIEYLKILLNNE